MEVHEVDSSNKEFESITPRLPVKITGTCWCLAIISASSCALDPMIDPDSEPVGSVSSAGVASTAPAMWFACTLHCDLFFFTIDGQWPPASLTSTDRLFDVPPTNNLHCGEEHANEERNPTEERSSKNANLSLSLRHRHH